MAIFHFSIAVLAFFILQTFLDNTQKVFVVLVHCIEWPSNPISSSAIYHTMISKRPVSHRNTLTQRQTFY